MEKRVVPKKQESDIFLVAFFVFLAAVLIIVIRIGLTAVTNCELDNNRKRKGTFFSCRRQSYLLVQLPRDETHVSNISLLGVVTTPHPASWHFASQLTIG